MTAGDWTFGPTPIARDERHRGSVPGWVVGDISKLADRVRMLENDRDALRAEFRELRREMRKSQ